MSDSNVIQTVFLTTIHHLEPATMSVKICRFLQNASRIVSNSLKGTPSATDLKRPFRVTNIILAASRQSALVSHTGLRYRTDRPPKRAGGSQFAETGSFAECRSHCRRGIRSVPFKSIAIDSPFSDLSRQRWRWEEHHRGELSGDIGSAGEKRWFAGR